MSGKQSKKRKKKRYRGGNPAVARKKELAAVRAGQQRKQRGKDAAGKKKIRDKKPRTKTERAEKERAGLLPRIAAPLLLLLSVFWLEGSFKLFTVKTADMTGWLTTAAYASAAALVFSALTCIIPGRGCRWGFFAAELLLFIIYTGQYVHYVFYSSFFSLFSVMNGTGQIAQFAGSILRIMMDDPVKLLILAVPFILSVITVCLGGKKFFRGSAAVTAVCAVLAAALIILMPNTLDPEDGRVYSPYNIYYRMSAPFYSVRYFGLAETMTVDLYRYLTGFEEEIVTVIPSGTAVPTGDDEKEYNISSIDFASMAQSESRKTIADMHRYFASAVPTEKNGYTGIFEGKNLIFIVAESLCYGAIDPVMTPTLYRMAEEGFNYTHFYTPIYPVSTFDGEYMTLLSRLPQENVWSLYEARNNSLPYSFGNAFGALGYRTDAYHGWYHTYYHRDQTHPNLGYTWTAMGSGLPIKYSWPTSDVEMVELSADRFITDTPFMTYYLTVSGHLAYNYGGNAMAARHRQEAEGLPYSLPVRAYYACQKEFDDSLALLVEKLEQQGILDDTVIVITNDHYPYGLTSSEMSEFCGYMENEKFDTHRGVFIVYNSATEGQQIDKVCSNIDVLPTVSNMFGLEYDSRLMMGSDVMSETETMAVFSDRSWITSSGSYDAATQQFRKTRLAPVPEDYVEQMNSLVYYKFLMSGYILDNDYYSIVY